MAITISHLSKKIDGFTLLNDINLSIEPGEVVGLLGPNGAGKTTLIKIITNALHYEEGSVRICGIDVSEFPMLTSGKIGYLPEHNPLYEDMYVVEYLLFIAEIHYIKDARKRVNELVDLVGLKHDFRKKISALSKGYKQRVGLAQSLMSNPDVLILDEPTTGLDPNQIVEIRELIRKIGEHRTVIMSTHLLQEVKEICTRVVILNEGTVVADVADPKEMRALPDGKRVLNVEFQNETSVESLEKIEGVLHVTPALGNNYHLEMMNDIRRNVFDYAVANNNPILTMQFVSRTMEQIFREYTAKDA